MKEAVVRALIRRFASIGDGSVTTAKIADGAVTFAKLNGAAVITSGEGLRANDNDTSLPASAAVIDALGPQLQTAQSATGSNTVFDFTGIPTWVNRVTVTMVGISTSGTSPYVLRVGDGAIVASGYTGAFTIIAGATPNSNNAASGIGILQNPTAASVYHGVCVLMRHSGNTWVATSTGGLSNAASTALSGGSITLAGALDRVRLTTSGGTDTFDAGSVNISWE